MEDPEDDEIVDHEIPVKSEHQSEDQYDDAEHVILEKGEHQGADIHHLPKEEWRLDSHAKVEHEEAEKRPYDHFEEGEEIAGFGIEHDYEPQSHTDEKTKKYMQDAPDSFGKLQPKTPAKDDPRVNIPQGKATAIHDHIIVGKEPVPAPEHQPQYGQAYESQKKAAKHRSSHSAALSPKQPIREHQVMHEEEHTPKPAPCSAFGTVNRCSGMTCDNDGDCASHCCG